jgi:hypothetical protein
MALKPMNDTIFGTPVSEEAFDDLTQLFAEASVAFKASLDAKALGGDVETAERQILAQLNSRKPVNFLVSVTNVGPDCRELQVGDTAILPYGGGTMVTVINEETNEPMRIFAISERVVLARWRED